MYVHGPLSSKVHDHTTLVISLNYTITVNEIIYIYIYILRSQRIHVRYNHRNPPMDCLAITWLQPYQVCREPVDNETVYQHGKLRFSGRIHSAGGRAKLSQIRWLQKKKDICFHWSWVIFYRHYLQVIHVIEGCNKIEPNQIALLPSYFRDFRSYQILNHSIIWTICIKGW